MVTNQIYSRVKTVPDVCVVMMLTPAGIKTKPTQRLHSHAAGSVGQG